MGKSKSLREVRFAVCDCETDPFLFGRVPEPFLWGYYDGEDYCEFADTNEFVRHIIDKDVILYAHNGGKFDYHFLLDFFEPESEIMFINGRIARAHIGKCQLRDSYNILPIPLAAYMKDDIDYSIFERGEREKPHNARAISHYLRKDCEYLYSLVRAFIERHGLCLTQAGASMRLFERMYDMKAPETTADFFEEVRPYYYGGRVQCFQTGIKEEVFSVFDINSAYPRAMLDEHPFGTTFNRVSATLADSEETPQLFYHLRCIADGCFPWREKVGAKLVFPTDNVKRDYFVTGWEVRAALRHGAIRDVNVIGVYDTGETISFTDYIMLLFQERAAAKACGDKAGDILAKLAMNSLYGKWGADPSAYTRARLFPSQLTDVLMVSDVVRGRGVYTYAGALGDLVVGVRPLYEHEARYYNVATAASITGWVRAFLFDSIRRCEGVIYCDTDSIACRDGAALDQGAALGQWKKEGDFVRWAVAGRKMYAFAAADGSAKVASKGARLAPAEIERIAAGGKVTYRFDAPNFSVRYGARFVERVISATD